MIKASELRIGNWVLDDGEPSIVSQLGFGGISFFTINGFNCNRETGSVINTGIDKFNPIPLTPEILEKAGFENNNSYFKLGSFCIGDADRTGHYQKGRFYYFHSSAIHIPQREIPSIHQLQNLYFALTGEELQITL